MAEDPIAWDDATSPGSVVEALKGGDPTRAARFLDALSADLDATGRLIGEKAAKSVLAALRNYAWFEKLNQMAEKFEKSGQDDPGVRRQLAQARIEMGRIAKAIEGLIGLVAELEKSRSEPDLGPTRRKALEFELGEALGLLGRAYKQYYVNAGPSWIEPRNYDLERALEHYGRAYQETLGDYLWHGINYVALLTHRERIASARARRYSDDAQETARKILEEIDERANRGPLKPWDLANRVEANLALGDTPAAIGFTKEYLECPGIDPFNIQSTRRQLVEVWGLVEDTAPGDQILPMMTARLAELGGTPERVELDPGKSENYEKVWGATKYRSLRWLQEALERARCVARIGPSKYDGDGTGFLFDGAWISDAWAGRPLLLTNSHVCSDDPAVQDQYPYPSAHEELRAAFLGSGGASDAVEHRFDRVVWTSPPSELDATLLELESVPEGCTLPELTGRRPPVTTRGDARLNILGHPKGLDMRVSLQDNQIVSVGDRYIHYRTPTDPGSSGSPVFNQRWELVALHHASSKEKQANEGIRIDVILDAMKAELG